MKRLRSVPPNPSLQAAGQGVTHALLLVLLLLAPLPLGSNRPWSWTLLSLAAGILALIACAVTALDPNRPARRLPAGPALAFLAVCGWVGLQASGFAPEAWVHPLWGMAASAADAPLTGSISLAPEDSREAVMRLGAYGLVFWLAFQTCARRERARRLLQALSLAGLAYALFGLAAYWDLADFALWFPGETDHPAVRGPFVNRNSFATWLGLCLLCSLALLHERLRVQRNPMYSLPVGRQRRIEQFLLRSWRPLALLLVGFAALVLTHSRAGFGAFLAGALALALAVHYRQGGPGGRSLLAVAAAFGIGITAFVMTGEILLDRMDRMHLDAPGRFDVYAMTAGAIDDNPWAGFGYGSFADSFRLYRDDSVSAWYDKAHNTYLENLFELGWPAAMALFGAIGWLALSCLKGIANRRRDWIYPATAFAATVLVAVHSLFDFSLQIPAVAVTYAALLGAGCAQAVSSVRGTHG